MSNVAFDNVSPIKPNLKVVERRVADLDEGYAKLSNMLLEEYAGADLTKRQFKVLLAVLRKTYGWNKPMDRISDSQISEIAKLPVKRCNEAKLELVRMGLLKQQGGMFGPNKNVSEWCIPQNKGIPLETGDKTSLKLRECDPSKQGDTKDTIQKKKEITPISPVGDGSVQEEKPQRPVSKFHFDRERFKDTWNRKAEKHGLPRIISISATTEKGVKRLYDSHLKHCKETGRPAQQIDTFINGYIEFGYTPSAYACGDNPAGKKYGIETALRQERIDKIISQEE